MKKLMKLCVKTILISILLTLLVSGAAFAADYAGPLGPAPNMGDGTPDGSGIDAPNGANGDASSEPVSEGPAPNSGDGVSDGSGF